MPDLERESSRVHGFITPPLDGPPTGGTLYNAGLIGALRRAGVHCECASLELDLSAIAASGDRVWVDSLYLDALPELRARFPAARLWLLVHYLPSLVRVGRELHRDDLDPSERAALRSIDGCLVTSPFMEAQVVRLGFSPRAVVCVEPGVELPAASARAGTANPCVRAVMLCNLVEGKGVLPWLEALASKLQPSDACELHIAGSLHQDARYADACRALIASEAALRERVTLLGALPSSQAVALLQTADVFVSASRMESYGMALAEARALGVPILARPGGNVGAHVEAAAGGALLQDERQLAGAWLALVRNRPALDARREAAMAQRRARNWDDAAAEFIARTR